MPLLDIVLEIIAISFFPKYYKTFYKYFSLGLNLKCEYLVFLDKIFSKLDYISASSGCRMEQSKKGLIYCTGNQFKTNPFCPTKLVELLLSSAILGVVIFDIVIRYRREKQVTSVFFALFTLMALALICNISFCLDHTIYAFNFLQGFFYNIYFSVIVYYVAFKLLLAMQARQHYKWILHGLFGIVIIFQISVLIEKFIQTYTVCQQLWYLIVNGLSIGLSILLTCLGATYTQKQIKKIERIQNPTHYKNPLPNIWIWISVNIFSQLCSFVQSMVFQLRPSAHCTFSENFGVDEGVKLLFAFLSFHLGMISTIIFFRNKYRSQEENMQKSLNGQNGHTRRASVNIQLMQQFGQNVHHQYSQAP